MPPDGRLVHDAADPVHHEHGVGHVGQPVRGVAELLVSSEDSVSCNNKGQGSIKVGANTDGEWNYSVCVSQAILFSPTIMNILDRIIVNRRQ